MYLGDTDTSKREGVEWTNIKWVKKGSREGPTASEGWDITVNTFLQGQRIMMD